MKKLLGPLLVMGLVVFHYSAAMGAVPDPITGVLSEEKTSGEEGLSSLRLGYSLGNYLGSSTFIGRPHFRQTLLLTSSYQLTDHETISGSFGGRGELFTSTNGSTDRLFLSDSNFGVSTSRVPKLSITDSIQVTFSPSLSYSLPISAGSRKIRSNWGSTSLAGTASTSLFGVSTSLSTSASYTFYEYTHSKYENKEEGDRTQEGYLLSPLNLGLTASVGYSFGDVGTRMSYGVYKSRSFANNAGNAYWRDYSSFSLSASYPIFSYLNLSSGYQYGADPLDGQGDLRIPFWSFYADYRNRSKIFLNLSGSFTPFKS